MGKAADVDAGAACDMSHGSYPRPSSPLPRNSPWSTARRGVVIVCATIALGSAGCDRAEPPSRARVDVPASAAAIETYLRAETPYDCAGSAKSEGLGIALLASIDNQDPSALVGLPLIHTCRLLRAAGIPLLD